MKLGTKLVFAVLAGALFVAFFSGSAIFYYTGSPSDALIGVLTVCASSLVFSALIMRIFGYPTIRSFDIFSRAIDEVTKGNLSVKVEIDSRDEVGRLAEAFNNMIVQLQKERENIEKKVEERTADLEKINKFMVGREIKMIDLKKQISELTKNQCRVD